MPSSADPPIRPPAAADLPAMKAVIDATELFPSEMLDGMTAPFLADPANAEEAWLVAEAQGAPVGIAYLAAERMTQGCWNALLLAVRPDHQGRGVGAALMRRVEAEAAARGARLLLVETSGLPEFAPTRAFYAAIGYAEEARIRDFYQAGEDKIVFRKPLGD